MTCSKSGCKYRNLKVNKLQNIGFTLLMLRLYFSFPLLKNLDFPDFVLMFIEKTSKRFSFIRLLASSALPFS